MTTYVKTQLFQRANETHAWSPAAHIDLTVSGGATPTDTSNEIDVIGAKEIIVQVNHAIAGSDSTTLDCIVYTRSGATIDTETYASINIGAAKIKSFAVTPGMAYLKIKVANNDAANTTEVLPTVYVTY